MLLLRQSKKSPEMYVVLPEVLTEHDLLGVQGFPIA